MTIIIGWWAIPVIITALSFGWVFATGANDLSLGGAITSAVMLLIACIVSLIAWLIWAVLT